MSGLEQKRRGRKGKPSTAGAELPESVDNEDVAASMDAIDRALHKLEKQEQQQAVRHQGGCSC